MKERSRGSSSVFHFSPPSLPPYSTSFPRSNIGEAEAAMAEGGGGDVCGLSLSPPSGFCGPEEPSSLSLPLTVEAAARERELQKVPFGGNALSLSSRSARLISSILEHGKRKRDEEERDPGVLFSPPHPSRNRGGGGGGAGAPKAEEEEAAVLAAAAKPVVAAVCPFFSRRRRRRICGGESCTIVEEGGGQGGDRREGGRL